MACDDILYWVKKNVKLKLRCFIDKKYTLKCIRQKCFDSGNNPLCNCKILDLRFKKYRYKLLALLTAT